MKRDVSLQQVLDHPDDDQLRLVYADVLSERGDPRGELISVQCALMHRPDDAALRLREAELLNANRREWFGPLEHFLRARNPEDASGYLVKGGFVHHVRARLNGERGEVDELFRLVPSLRSLEVNGEGLTASRALHRLRRLCITGVVGAFSELLSEGFFDELEALDLQVIDGEPGPGLSRLKSLVEFRSIWGMRGLFPLPRKLKTLDAYGQDVIRTQLTTPRKALREFVLRSATVTIEDAEALTKQAPYLEQIMLKMAVLSREALERLFRVEWPHLKVLELHGVSLSHEGVATLGELVAPALRTLELNIVQLRDEGAQQVVAMPWFSQLNRLSLVANRLTDAGVLPLIKAKHSLVELDLQKNNQISKAMFTRLQRAESFRNTQIVR